MTAPSIVSTIKDDWKKVATNVTSAILFRSPTSVPRYSFTFVDTGDPAPSGAPSVSNPGIVFDDLSIEFEYPTGCDLYIFSDGAVGAIEVHV